MPQTGGPFGPECAQHEGRAVVATLHEVPMVASDLRRWFVRVFNDFST